MRSFLGYKKALCAHLETARAMAEAIKEERLVSAIEEALERARALPSDRGANTNEKGTSP